MVNIEHTFLFSPPNRRHCNDTTEIPHIPENLSPVRLAYYLLRSTGIINKEARPWSILLAIYHIIMVCIVILGSALEVFLSNGDFVDKVPALSVSTGSSHIFTKGVNVLLNQTQILGLMNRLEELRREILQDEENRHFVLRADYTLRKIVTYTMAFFLCFPFISLAMNLISEHFSDSDMPHFIIPMWIPWKVYNSWTHSATLLWMVLLLMSVVGYYVSTTTLTLTISFQLAAFLKVIRARLEKHGPRDKSIFRHHSEIIQLIHSYNEIFSGQLYFEILISSLQPCGFGYALLKAIKRNDPTTLDLVYKSLITIVAPFFICLCGQMISTQMDKLHESAFMGPWYVEKPAIRRNLLQMMTVTVKTVTWNYREIVTFNMICFATVLQGIYSYLTMLINYDKNEQI